MSAVLSLVKGVGNHVPAAVDGYWYGEGDLEAALARETYYFGEDDPGNRGDCSRQALADLLAVCRRPCLRKQSLYALTASDRRGVG